MIPISIRIAATLAFLIPSAIALAQGSAISTLGRADSVIAGVRTAVYDVENINWNIDGSVDTARGRIFIERHGIADGVGFKLRFDGPSLGAQLSEGSS